MDSSGKLTYTLFDTSSSFYSEVSQQLDTKAVWKCKCKVEETGKTSDPNGVNLILAHRNKIPFKTLGNYRRTAMPVLLMI